MMCKTRTKPARRFRALAAVPALALAMSLLNVPSISGAMTEMSSARLTDKVSGFSTNRQTADKGSVRSVKDENGDGESHDVMAEFPGGMPALMAALARISNIPPMPTKPRFRGVWLSVSISAPTAECRISRSLKVLIRNSTPKPSEQSGP